MIREPTIAAGPVRGLMDFAASKGANRQDLIERSGIRPEDLEDLDNRIPLSKHIALNRAAKALCNDPALALHYAEEINFAQVSVVGLLGEACETMIEAFVQLNRYSQLVVEVDVDAASRFELTRNAAGLWIVDNRKNPNDYPEQTEGAFARIVVGTRRFGDTPFVLEVHVTHADPGYREEYERILGAPVVFGSNWNALRIDESWLSHKVAVQPRYAFGILSAHVEALQKRLDGSKTVRGRVESLLVPILHTGNASIDIIASKLGISRQTLFRQLKAEGTTFAIVLDELRHQMALHYLNGKKVSVNQTAYLVGFSDRTAFSRAFKRWTGSSPGTRSAPRR